jgi:hypothetical protein
MTITADDGSYVIEGLPDGNYLVSAVAQGGWRTSMRWWRDAETPDQADFVELINGATSVPSIDIALPLDFGTASISGTVRLSDGSPVFGASVGVIVIDPTDSTVLFGASAMSDYDGSYTIPYLPAGSYIVYASYWDGGLVGSEFYLDARDPSTATPVLVADDEQRTGIDFSLDMTSYYGTVAGQVTVDATGAPIANAYVELSPAGATVMGGEFNYWNLHAVTDAQGRYVVENVPAGEYFVAVVSNGAYEYYDDVQNPESATTISVLAADTTMVDFGLTTRSLGNGSIAGHVSSTFNGELDVAIIAAFPANATEEVAFPAVAVADGNYTIWGLADGDYVVYAFAPDHIGEFYEDAWDVSEATIVSVRDGAAVGGINFGLEPWGCFPGGDSIPVPGAAGGIVHGMVTDNGGDAIADANVYVVDAQKKAIASVRTKADGSYSIAGLPLGEGYRVMATSVGYATEYNDDARRFEDAEPVEIRRGSIEINFDLASGTSSVKDESRTTGITIAGAFPNPFTTSTSVRFSLEKQQDIDVTIVNARGETVARLHDGVLGGGSHELRWDGRSADGTALESGIYFARIAGTAGTRTVPVTLAR